ncbi:hypothetical protein DNTS_003657 [Danionella cerebrum]|nr:hypothetical protein DNTS_003657 [Danionella translucida]
MVTLKAPYVAGFLGFREAPPLLQTLEKLKNELPDLMPQVLFVDGNGLFHSRECGLACHLGVQADLPCVGVAKNLLHLDGVVKSDEHQSQSSSKPVYVSVGHRISLATAVSLTHRCCLYRVPEPIRQADLRSREYLRSHILAPDVS